MERIIIHWTGGKHTPNTTDINHYHYIISGDGEVVKGKYEPEDNLSVKTKYAAHTRGLNTGSIGVSLAGMFGAREAPLDVGDYPITEVQVEVLASLVARLCEEYDIPVTRTTVLTHAEVQPTLGVKQRFKWDIVWLPGMTKTEDPIKVGDKLRLKIKSKEKRCSFLDKLFRREGC